MQCISTMILGKKKRLLLRDIRDKDMFSIQPRLETRPRTLPLVAKSTVTTRCQAKIEHDISLIHLDNKKLNTSILMILMKLWTD